MQAISVSSGFDWRGSSSDYSEISGKFSENFGAKLKIDGSVREFMEDLKEGDEHVNDEEGGEEVGEEEEEFSFVCTNPDGSPISADDVFQNGRIRPVFPIFNRDLLFADAYDGDTSRDGEASSLRPPLRKLFVQERDPSSSSSSESDELEAIPEGTYCEWAGKAADASPELGKKSNSTGFSKLWRFRDLVHRSNSDGKDAFVFLNPNSSARPVKVEKNEKAGEKERKSFGEAAPPPRATAKAKNAKTASSAHEKHYVRNRAKKEEDKRRSYLPYRPDLVGFFTSVNGLSRNVHPF
ncbi:hypothetical protein UlMin_040285 [Ulmus minor]